MEIQNFIKYSICGAFDILFKKYLANKLNRNDLVGLEMISALLEGSKKTHGIKTTEIDFMILRLQKCARKFEPPIEARDLVPSSRDEVVCVPQQHIRDLTMRHMPPSVRSLNKNFSCEPVRWSGNEPLKDVMFMTWIPYFVSNNVSNYSDKLRGFYYGFDTIPRRDRYLDHFQGRFDSINTEIEFISICHQICEVMDREHRIDSEFFVEQWENSDFRQQRSKELTIDYYERLKKTFELAFPTASTCNEMRLRFCRNFILGLVVILGLCFKYLSRLVKL